MDIEKNNYENNNNDISIKYAMFSYYKGAEECKELYIVIGQNPSYSSKNNIDGTNRNILKVIKNSFNENCYLMLNTFPMICSDGAEAEMLLNSGDYKKYIENNIKISEKILNEFTDGKIIIAWGISNSICNGFIEILKNKNLYCFTYDNEIIPHMSMQVANLNKRDTKKYEICKCNIDVVEKKYECVKIEKESNQYENENNLFDLQKEYDELLLDYSKSKYEDEMRRADTISNQCNFYMGIITVLIAAVLSVFGFIKPEFKDMFLSIIFVGTIVILLIISLILIIFANYFFKKDYLSKTADVEDILGDDKNKWRGIISQSYNQTVESFNKVNSKRIKIIRGASRLLIIALVTAVIFGVIIMIRSR